jgi:hypothetical protein
LDDDLSTSRKRRPSSAIVLRMSLTPSARRWLAAALALCSLATLTLLFNHPAAGGHTLVDIMKTEASNRFVDGLVHGGFIATLSVLIVCFVFLSRNAGMDRVTTVVGLVTVSIGTGALMASMILDGFVIPALALRFNAPGFGDHLVEANALFIFCGTLIRFLMPMGLCFQSIAILSWSLHIVERRGWRLAVGTFGIAVGTLMIGAICVAPPRLGEHVVLGGIALNSVWYLALAGGLSARRGWPASSAA